MSVGVDEGGSDAVARQIAPPSHWSLSIVVALTSTRAKDVGSTEGMQRTQQTSPFFPAWIASHHTDLTEARIAMNAEEAQIMRDTSQALPELVAQIVPSPMTLWADSTVKRLIAEGYVGKILSVEVSASGTFLDPDAPMSWRQNYDLSGMNIMSMGIWYESMMR